MLNRHFIANSTDEGRSSPTSEPLSEQEPAQMPSTPTDGNSRTSTSSRGLKSASKRTTSSPLSLGSSRKASSFRGFMTSHSRLEKETDIMTAPLPSPSTPETVRRRRGFRPLSVITSALYPFNFDPTSAMDTVQSAKLTAPLTVGKAKENTASTSMSGQTSDMLTPHSDTSSDSTPSPMKSSSLIVENVSDDASVQNDKHSASPTAIDSSQNVGYNHNGGERPETKWFKTKNGWFKADFPHLTNLPQPELNKHPAFQTDAFRSSDSGSVFTTSWTPEQIRKWSATEYFRKRSEWGIDEATIFDRLDKDQQTKILATTNNVAKVVQRKAPKQGQTSIPVGQAKTGTSTPSVSRSSVGKREKSSTITSKASDDEEADIFEILAEGSPAPSAKKTPRTPQKQSVDSASSAVDLRVATNTSTPITDTLDRANKNSSSLRSFSELFKTRSGSEKYNEKASASSSTFEHPAESPEIKRYDLVCTNATHMRVMI